ncbi:MAG: CAAX prenyl protease-related protein [Burkholderiaceae bacterium]|nr:CAAX prenyl protease-related protein [Burkholderiaceae bacterium]
MGSFLSRPVLARVLPFMLFMILLAVRGYWPAGGLLGIDARWVYGLSVLLVGGSLAFFWKDYTELARPALPGKWTVCLSVLVGLVVFGLWINLAEPWMMLGEATASFHPVDSEGRLEWDLVVVRWIGAALMVPVMEELFWRSFLMRWVDKPAFEQVDPGSVSAKAMALSTIVFMLAHTQWLAAIVAGLAYAYLYKRSGSLWAPVIAHGVTNGVLGIWVVLTGHWAFW